MSDSKHAGIAVECVTFRIQIFMAGQAPAAAPYRIDVKIQPQHIRGSRVKSGVGNRALPIGNLSYGRTRTEQMRFISGSPLGNGPESVHKPPRTVRELIRKPPLSSKRRMS